MCEIAVHGQLRELVGLLLFFFWRRSAGLQMCVDGKQCSLKHCSIRDAYNPLCTLLGVSPGGRCIYQHNAFYYGLWAAAVVILFQAMCAYRVGGLLAYRMQYMVLMMVLVLHLRCQPAMGTHRTSCFIQVVC